MSQGFTGSDKSSLINSVVDGRLTLTSGTPVTISDVTAATVIYYTPYIGTRLSLYNTTSSKWELRVFSEMSITVPATTNQMYDIFVYDSSGTLTLELVAWTNDTTRATALAYQDGVYVKTGALGRRYLGSVRTTGVSGQTEDSDDKRYVWNYYNRVYRVLDSGYGSTNHTYGTATWRAWNASTSSPQRMSFIIGVKEDGIYLDYNYYMAPGAAGTTGAVGADLNWTAGAPTNVVDLIGSTGATMTTLFGSSMTYSPTASNYNLGYNYIQMLEWANNTTTFDNYQVTVSFLG